MELLRTIGLLKRLQVPSIVVNLGLGVVSLFPIWQDNLFDSSFAYQRVEVRRGNTNRGNSFSGRVHSLRGFLSVWHTCSTHGDCMLICQSQTENKQAFSVLARKSGELS